MQWRGRVLVPRIGIGAMSEENFDDGAVIKEDRVVQRGGLAIAFMGIGVRPMRQKQRHRLEVSGFRGEMERSAAGAIALVDVCGKGAQDFADTGRVARTGSLMKFRVWHGFGERFCGQARMADCSRVKAQE